MTRHGNRDGLRVPSRPDGGKDVMRAKYLVATAVAAILAASPAWAQKEIQWWHAMGGNLGDVVNALADGFNKSQTEYKVVPVFKGSYTETLTAGIAAFR